LSFTKNWQKGRETLLFFNGTKESWGAAFVSPRLYLNNHRGIMPVVLTLRIYKININVYSTAALVLLGVFFG